MTVPNRPTSPPSPATAYYNQRHTIAENAQRLRDLQTTIDSLTDLSAFQWAQWYSYALEYKPDLILELGRGSGNSTAAFTQSLYQHQHGRLVSLCLTDTWQTQKTPLLRKFVETDWFDRLDARIANILDENYEAIIGDARRVMLLWDAHGFQIASLVLGKILPLLADREHLVIMHDISDQRYLSSSSAYNDAEIWQGQEWIYRTRDYESRLRLGWINTIVDQAIAITDFMSRNNGELGSADQSFHEELGRDEIKREDMRSALPAEVWNMTGHWAYFSLNYLPGPFTFPKFVRASDSEEPYSFPKFVRASDSEELPAEQTKTVKLLKILAQRIAKRLHVQ